MRYAVVIERAGGGVPAYVPDLPGCIATAADVAAVEREIREAIRLHVEGLRADGLRVPEPSSLALNVEAGAPDLRCAAGDGQGSLDAFSEWASPIDEEDYADL